MKLLPILLLITISGLTQPKTYLTDAFLRNDSLFATSNGVTVFKGKVTKQVISYLPEKGNYLSETSGTGRQSIGYWNTAIGDNALDSTLSDASYNICFGKDAGKSITNGSDNFYAGWDAGYHTKTGSENIGIVEDAL